jgi:protein-tyrosine phosphatase
MIDLHCHVLPGIDDGPATIEESVALIREAAATGADVLVATPHVSRRYQNEAATIARLVDEMNAQAVREGLAIEIRAGAEIAASRIAEIEPDELHRFGLGGGTWLLVEPSFSPIATGLDILLLDLQRRGHRILLAHPERCPAFHRAPEVLESLVEGGALTSITAGSFVGRFGPRARKLAFELVHARMAHSVASDAHDLSQRPPGMLSELEEAGIAGLADWLTREVPAAILDGSDIPRRPDVALENGAGRRRAWWRRLTGSH